MKKAAQKLKPMHLNLDPSVHSALMELSEATGIPASQYVGQFLRASVVDITHLARAARAAQSGIRTSVRELQAA
jgi:hypothetical protein